MENTYTHKNNTPEFINKNMDKKGLNKLLSQMYLEYGGAKTAELANTLKNLGYKYATKSGVTISIADLSVPASKKDLLKEAEAEIEKSTNRYLKGEITEVERYTKVIDTWSETTAKLTEQVVENFDKLNPVYMMAFSGARGNLSQVSQLVGMRGLMADAQGQIIDLPIKSNFKEGLSVTEYIISSYGARKGLVDTALKTADSGYLTRRLVDVAQDVIIREHDCHTTKAITMTAISDGEKVVVPLAERLLGRTIAEDIKDEKGNVVIPANTTMDRDDVKVVEELNVQSLRVRSGLTCVISMKVPEPEFVGQTKDKLGNTEVATIVNQIVNWLKDFDINLVRNSTIQEISEELWITSSRYWLSYALLSITAWINNYEEVAKNALAECVRRDPVKATLFFCLFNLRFGYKKGFPLRKVFFGA
mgnify:CR=1 FL=1